MADRDRGARWPTFAAVGAVAAAVVCCLGLPLLATFGVALIAGLLTSWQPLVLGVAAIALLATWAWRRRPGPPAAKQVELLFFDGCPNHERYLPRLRELIARAGTPAQLELLRVNSDQDAQESRFLGSPTVRVDGHDVEPEADAREDFGLQCRLYRTAGAWSGTPPDEWVLGALAGRAAEQH